MTHRRMIILTIVLFVGATGSFSVLAQDGVQSNPPITVFLAGDSTVSSYGENRAPLTGWGQVLERFFTDEISVINEAVSGRSSKSFIAEGHLGRILNAINPGDYLIIQFGHNDQKIEDPSRYAHPGTTFKSYLKQYINGAREKGAHPILVTRMHSRTFGPNGKLRPSRPTQSEYPAAMRELAAEMEVPLIDLYEKSMSLFERLGPSGTIPVFLWLEPGQHENYPDGMRDNTHFTEYGAEVLAKLVVDGLKEIGNPLAEYVREYGEHLYWREPIGIVVSENIGATGALRGIVPFDVALIHLNGEPMDRWDEIEISVDDEIIYRDTKLPTIGELTINTMTYEDGYHELAVAVHHREFGSVVKRVPFIVRNWWQITDELLPPVSGWWEEFGAIERLRTERKSDGWGYVGDQADLFSGDRTRLVRDGTDEEFLIWAAPGLRDFEVIVFLQRRKVEDGGITLSVSEDGAQWMTLPLAGDDAENTMVKTTIIDASGEGWRTISLHATLQAAMQANWFRITFEDGMPAKSAQLGKVTLRGLNVE